MQTYQFSTIVENGMIKIPVTYSELNSQSVKVIVLLGEENKSSLPYFVKPLRQTISIEELKIEQNYKGFDTKAFELLCQEFDEEFKDEKSIEELLAML